MSIVLSRGSRNLRAVTRSLRRLIIPVALTMLAANSAANDGPTTMRIALVFDDGPVPELCEKFLATLARENVKATFSHEGRYVTAHPHLARAVLAAGHEIANHSYHHPHFNGLDPASVVREIRETQAAVKSATGLEPRWLWTPYLDWDETIAQAVETTGMRHMPLSHLHLVSSEDWDRSIDAAAILRNATRGIKDRTVILCHERRAETLAQLPAILTELRQQGCVFLTFSELAATLTPQQLSDLR